MEIKLKIGAISRDNSEYCHYAIPENRAEDREKPRKISRIRAWGDRAEISPTPNIGYRAPVRQFWTPGPGTFLRKAELRINDRLSELDELISKYGRPIGVFRNVSPTFTPEIGPGRFMRLCRGGTGYTGEGYADGGEPSAEYLQAQLAIESIWVDLEKYMKQVSTAVNLPYTALELEYSDAPSGISLIIKAAPLLTRARQRRPIYQLAELGLARKVLTACGNHYGHADLLEQAKQLQLLLAWAEPRIPIPGPDRDQSDEWEMQVGIKSQDHRLHGALRAQSRPGDRAYQAGRRG